MNNNEYFNPMNLENLYIERSEKSPLVDFNLETNEYKLMGRSLLEDSVNFFDKVLDWLRSFNNQFTEDTIFDDSKKVHLFSFKMEYFNSASGKYIYEFFKIINQIYLTLDKHCPNHTETIEVDWLFMEGDEIMQEIGEEIQELTDLEFNFVSVTA